MNNRKCENCRFWFAVLPATKTEKSEGECFRYAPKPRQILRSMLLDETDEPIIVWPMTVADMRCGEWKAEEITTEDGVVIRYD